MSSGKIENSGPDRLNDPFFIDAIYKPDGTVDLVGNIRMPVDAAGVPLPVDEADPDAISAPADCRIIRDNKDLSVDPIIVSPAHWAHFLGRITSTQVE